MTVPQPSESARLAQLEQRVQALEDVNAIRYLKARYAAYCDDQYNPDGLAALFTEDAVWESEGLGRFEGRGDPGVLPWGLAALHLYDPLQPQWAD
jgi:hypothetical protein